MIDHGSDSSTAISNGSRYSSRRVASSTTLFIVLRSVSDSLATRCLRQAPTPRVLQPAHVRGGELAGQQRVLGVRLEEPAAEQRAVQVDGRAEHDVDLLGHRLLGEQPPDLVRGVLAPGRGQQRGVGEQRDGPAAAELQPAYAGRAVGQAQLTAARSTARRQGERGRAGQQAHLGRQVQRGDQGAVVRWRHGLHSGRVRLCGHVTPLLYVMLRVLWPLPGTP